VSTTLFGTAVLASFLGGVLALFAPCCISVMLPAYFANTFRRRTALTSMTLTFAVGVGAVILPIAFGATAISQVVNGQHGLVFGIGGSLMVLMGLATLAGRKFPMPGIGMRARVGHGAGSVLALGAFSGVASACCTPVLAGVVVVSAAATSFLTALILGVAYVFGMVAPLFAMALLWDRYDWGRSALLRGLSVPIPLPGRRAHVPLSTLLSGVLLVGMGALVIVIAVQGPGMSAGGAFLTISAALQHVVAHVVVTAVGHGPAWLVTIAILAALVFVVWKGMRQATSARPPLLSEQTDEDSGEPVAASQSKRLTETWKEKQTEWAGTE
jgi:cytochrome c biogenesis protein CcdA